MADKERKLLKELYFSSPAGFSSKARLIAEAGKQGIEAKTVEKFLASTPTYTLNQKHYKKDRRRRRVYAFGVGSLMAIDLAFFPKQKGQVGVLIAVDVFSRKGYARPIKSKEGAQIAKNLNDIFSEQGFPPDRLSCDRY